MFEIGTSLRRVRERRGLELTDVERETRIRTRYLKALEDERFELIPGAAYAKGFLRTYADYLGLDADRFVDELTVRLPSEEEVPAQSAPYPAGRRHRLAAPAPLAALVLVIGAGVALWLLGSTSRPKEPAATGRAPAPANQGALGSKHVQREPQPAPALANLVLRATGGRCWIEAHAGSRSGTQLYFSMLEEGGSLRFARKRIWLRLGAPVALRATLNGKPVVLPRASPSNVVVTAQGVEAA